MTKELEMICDWYEIAVTIPNPEGRMITCSKCDGKNDKCNDYTPQPSTFRYLREIAEGLDGLRNEN